MKAVFSACLAMTAALMCGYNEVRADDYWDDLDYSVEDCYQCCDDSGYFITADLLIWTVHQDGINTLISSNVGGSTSNTDALGNNITSNSGTQQLQKFCFDWKAGYRLGIGYYFADGWTTAATWTHYHGRGHGHGHQANLEMSGNWSLNYDVVDLTLATPYYCAGSHFAWNVVGGVKIGVIDQVAHANNQALFTNIYTSPGSTTTNVGLSSDAVRFSSDYTAMGPELGVTGVWNIGCGISLFGNVSGALMYGRFKEKFSDNGQALGTNTVVSEGTTTTTSTTTNSYNYNDSDHICRPALDLGIGISWCDHVLNFPVLVRLGWEQHRWIDQLGAGGSLYLNGVTLSAYMAF